jgi:hypothetical protein
MKNKLARIGLCLGLVFASISAHANFVNGSFENNFADWSIVADPYLVTMDGGSRVRHDYHTFYGWEGADVWFSGNAAHGATYAVVGSNGNESNGTLRSSLWTATNQYVTFSHAGNNTSFINPNDRAYGSILDIHGFELSRVYVTSYNDSVWRDFSLDLSALGFNLGDQFYFQFTDGYSWSVLDNVNQNGAALPSNTPSPVNVGYGIGALALMGMALRRKKKV